MTDISRTWAGDMSGAGHMDIELVREVLREATREGGPFTQRGLSKAAGLGRDAVGDIVNGRNNNPTIGTLTALAEAMGTTLAVFGLYMVSELDLQRAIREALPGLPKRGIERQTEYLTEVVGRVIGLPQDREATVHELRPRPGAEEGESPPSPTKPA